VEKATKLTVAQRTEEILKLRLDGAQFHDLFQYVSTQGWGIGKRQLRNYIRRTDTLIRLRQDKDAAAIIARHFAQRMRLYAKAVKAEDVRTALSILQDEARLRGLYPGDTITLQDKRTAAEPDQMADDELTRIAATGRATTDDAAGSRPGTPDPQAGQGEPAGVHPVYVPGLPGELAPPADLPPSPPVDGGGDQSAHDLHAAP
jgi:hypothetical protein